MICVTCYMTSKGAKMEDAVAVIAGESVCSEHLSARAEAYETAANTEVTPH